MRDCCVCKYRLSISRSGSVRSQVSHASKEKHLLTPRDDEVIEILAVHIATTLSHHRRAFEKGSLCEIKSSHLFDETVGHDSKQSTSATRVV